MKRRELLKALGLGAAGLAARSCVPPKPRNLDEVLASYPSRSTAVTSMDVSLPGEYEPHDPMDPTVECDFCGRWYELKYHETCPGCGAS